MTITRAFLLVGCLTVFASAAAGTGYAARYLRSRGPQPVTVFLERNGRVLEHDGERVAIPRFGGGDRAWAGIVRCVKDRFSAFQIEVVDRRPTGGDYITAIVGGRASQLGLDDRTTNGVGPYSPDRVLRNAVVHVFSKVGTGERDVANLCATTVHEVAHALGLDHTYKCGDVMSYFLDRCGPRRLLDVEAPCGEGRPRTCGDGKRTQNSFRKLAAAVGLRNQPEPEPEPEPDAYDGAWDPFGGIDPWALDDAGEPDGDDAADLAPRPPPAPRRREPAPRRPAPRPKPDEADDDTDDATPRGHGCGARHGTTYEHVQDRYGRTWLIVRRAR